MCCPSVISSHWFLVMWTPDFMRSTWDSGVGASRAAGLPASCSGQCEIAQTWAGRGVLHTVSQATVADRKLAHEQMFHCFTTTVLWFSHFSHSIFFLVSNDVLSLYSSGEFFRAYSLAFYFLFIHFLSFFPGKFTDLRSVTVISKSAFPAKSQIKSEFWG